MNTMNTTTHSNAATLHLAGANQALSLATLAFAANFSVWTLYAVLGLDIAERQQLSALQLGVLFSVPVLSGALGRIPAGLLADRFTPKHLLCWQMLLTTPPLFLLPWAESLQDYLWLGLWLGLSGTSFTLGIRYITDFFSSAHQGTAMGVFGAGNTGAAITLMFAPWLVTHFNWNVLGPVYGAGLLIMAMVFALWAPNRPPATESRATDISLRQALSHLQVWRFGLYYYFVFGSFLALILWLPQYYVSAYKLSFQQALAFTLFFVATSSMVRALGGWFADRYGGRTVNWMVFWICLVCLFFLSYPPTSMTIHGIERDVTLTIELNVWVFSALIFVIGLAQGFGRASVYKTIHDYYPRAMGTVGGLVAAMGALGGCTLPLAFGFAVDVLGIHSAAFMVLYGVLAACMIVMFFANRADRFQRRLTEAKMHNFLESE